MELCKISTAANSIGDFSPDRTERRSSEGESISSEVSGGSRWLHWIPNSHFVCLLNRPWAEWDWPQVHCKWGPLKVDGAWGQRFPGKLDSIVPDLPPPALSLRSYVADSSVSGRGSPSTPPNEIVPYRDPYLGFLIKCLRNWGLISFPPGERHLLQIWFRTEPAQQTRLDVSNFIKKKIDP